METFKVGQRVEVVAPHPEHATLLEAARRVRGGRKYIDGDTGRHWQALLKRANNLDRMVGKAFQVVSISSGGEQTLYHLSGHNELYPADCLRSTEK